MRNGELGLGKTRSVTGPSSPTPAPARGPQMHTNVLNEKPTTAPGVQSHDPVCLLLTRVGWYRIRSGEGNVESGLGSEKVKQIIK